VRSSVDKPERYGVLWTRDELILAFELYCRIPFRQTKANDPRVQELAQLLHRSPAAVARKLGNFGAFDPVLREQNISGLGHGSQLDRQVWDEFHSDWNGLVFEAHELRHSIAKPAVEESDPVLSAPFGPSERTRTTKERVHQTFFRQTVLSSYEATCCITGLRITECLVASHIVPWSVDDRCRTDPANGLCLSATFDRLFDRGLLTVTADYTVKLAPRLLQSSDQVTLKLIRGYHAKPIKLPHRFPPSKQHLDWHYRNVYQDNAMDVEKAT
jgi:putative restriction endonuclease